ncbi:pilus assembly protein PilM [Paraburkholderia bonniea]|uniref:type IV pilus biogenesis protein PilM n=1 Tax=Paraburkholderia bonniea TaxID=2152891 RepID=UPI001291F944|nr:pilus assembly protein PilM [Paraburkholderia bonniea]WJF90582.1 pilus assembly protein PilM [Paraburkholderia bonniea]WJF93897.1 pilus assembly protein PilM [Paraburkholderia bonniea]
MVFDESWLMAVRRFAVGLDVSPQAVRLVALSQRGRARSSLRIEAMASWPLPEGAMAGAEIIDRMAVSQALREVFNQLPSACAGHVLHCAMAVPASVTLTATLPLAALASSGSVVSNGFKLAGLEPAVMAEAERIAGVERHALAVDWFVDPPLSYPERLSIAVTARRHLEARVECAALAGIVLTTLDGEPDAALRAMRYAANIELDPDMSYIALWLSWDGVHGWRVADGQIAGAMRYPDAMYADLADALRELAAGEAPSCALIGGDLDLLGGMCFSLADMGDVLGCVALPFECSAFGECLPPRPNALLREPACAVACGLALRGVME